MMRHAKRFLPLLVLWFITSIEAQDKKSTNGGSSQGQNQAQNPGQSDDVSAVKRVLAARQEYQASLEELRAQYLRTGDVEHVRWVEDELLSYHRISKRAYRLDLDVPPPTLTPNQNNGEANDLFRRAVAFKSKGWGQELDDNYRRAELLFQQLITLYPQSDKLSETAYHLGDIYESRAFKQYRRAAVYYERSFQWNQQTSNDSRLKAARLYDRTLSDHSKAIQLYRDEITHTADPKRLEEAQRRLHELGSTPP
jgi:tetratricopeptide (TPR) repeat protein